MADAEPQTLIVGEGASAREIKFFSDAPADENAPSVFWLSGFMSDMASTKSTALAAFAAQRGYGCARFDYSGHGVSGGAFRDGTIGRWLEEARAVFTKVTRGRQIIVGSSMGGHIALLLLRALMRDDAANAQRISGLVLIAPAWDMTEDLMWKKFPQQTRDEILSAGFHMWPSNYDQPYMITRALIEDGREHLFGDAPFDPQRRIVILQGAADVDVPLAHVRRLVEKLEASGQCELIVIDDGEHRLSRPQDLELLFATVARLADAPG